jgi:indole-3-glycerol phosphate synthase
VKIIAEVKTHSPFGWEAGESWEELFELAERVGDIISIHTDARWHGSFELLAKARARTHKPILAKGIHATDAEVVRALEAGADYVLVVGRVPGMHLAQCMVEPNTLTELAALPTAVKAVWNSRDLATGGRKPDNFAAARKVFGGWLCQASNIRTVRDVDERADAVLVGSHLRQFADSL